MKGKGLERPPEASLGSYKAITIDFRVSSDSEKANINFTASEQGNVPRRKPTSELEICW